DKNKNLTFVATKSFKVMWDATQVLISSREDYNKRLKKAESVETSTSTSKLLPPLRHLLLDCWEFKDCWAIC
ncbi:hypothetical protein Tco_0056661, partial [Tanacetum coccineum]